MKNPCRAERYCRNRDSQGNPGEATSRGLCLTCERHGLYAIGSLPEDYVQMSIFLAKEGSGFGAGIPTHQVEAPIPIRLDVEALMSQVRTTLLTWERDVRYQAHLSPAPQWGVRHGVAVDRAARILHRHYSVLMALRVPSAALDGIDGIVELTRLHHRCRYLFGEALVWEWREMPCPTCSYRTLGRWSGSEKVECTTCYWWCTLDEYADYVLTLKPPNRKVAA